MGAKSGEQRSGLMNTCLSPTNIIHFSLQAVNRTSFKDALHQIHKEIGGNGQLREILMPSVFKKLVSYISIVLLTLSNPLF